jgi:ribosome biogenesis GTPase / thiamine phosphate phosphatase
LEILCVVRALLKKMQQRVLVGDWVAMSAVEWTAQRAMVNQLLQRTGQTLSDPPVANAQQLVLCFAINDPPVEAVQLTRFLVSAEASGVPFVLVFNKADLDADQRRQVVTERLAAWGYHGETAPHFVSVATGEGLQELQSRLRDRVTVIAGPSGVGKSSLINALRGVDGAMAVTAGDVLGAGGGNKGRHHTSGGGLRDWQLLEDDADEAPGDDVDLERSPFEMQTVKSVSGRSRRGRHTTRHVSLLRLPGGGLLADTPGFSLPGLEHVTTRELADCFPEARAALDAGSCAFGDCTHRGEPGCVVVGEPLWDRYPFYLELFEELTTRETAQARTTGKREAGVRTKARRGDGAAPRMEVKLTPHKHRRTSRTNANAQVQTELTQALVDQQDSDGH